MIWRWVQTVTSLKDLPEVDVGDDSEGELGRGGEGSENIVIDESSRNHVGDQVDQHSDGQGEVG